MEASMFEIQEASLRILLPSEVDHPVSDEIRRKADQLMSRNYIKRIIFDFGATTFMDSSGIGLIMGRYKALGLGKGCILAVNVSSHVEKLLRLSGLHKFMEIRKKVEIAGE